MKIQGLNNINFGAKKFRLPVKIVKNTESITAMQPWGYKDEFVSGNFVREYNNPKAEEYFNKAMASNNIDEKMRYLDKMGDYKIIDINLEQQLDKFIKMGDKMP